MISNGCYLHGTYMIHIYVHVERVCLFAHERIFPSTAPPHANDLADFNRRFPVGRWCHSELFGCLIGHRPSACRCSALGHWTFWGFPFARNGIAFLESKPESTERGCHKQQEVRYGLALVG